MDGKKCSICGEENDDYLYTLGCNHTFHYQCLFLSFKNSKNNDCPYCRSKNNFLPIVPGVKKFNPKIHDWKSDTINLIDQKCEMVLKKGKNKGNKCTKNCKLGYNYCTVHLKQVNNIKTKKQE